MVAPSQLAFTPPPDFDHMYSGIELALFAPTSRHPVAVAIAGLTTLPLSITARRVDDGDYIPMIAATANVAGM